VYETNKLVAILAATGIILSPIYLLKMYHLTALGEITHEENKNLKDLSLLESSPLILLSVLTILLGLYPKLVMNVFEGMVSFITMKGI
jgi:NADH-quinone oxidoreductase subunit M